MKKHSRWFKLKRIIPATILLPPVGLLLLWLSPRSRRLKATLTVFAMLFFAGAGFAVWKTGYYEKFQEPPVPESGFDISRDETGRYRIDRILPFEREIFVQVVREKRRFEKEQGQDYVRTDVNEIVDPETQAVEVVAERNGMDTHDVSAIFLKVSSKMTRLR